MIKVTLARILAKGYGPLYKRLNPQSHTPFDIKKLLKAYVQKTHMMETVQFHTQKKTKQNKKQEDSNIKFTTNK